METFKSQRAEKICRELGALITKQCAPICNWKLKKGSYLTPEQAENSQNPWIDFNSNTDYWSGHNQSYWFKSSFTVPKSFNGKDVWISIKTQKNDWDAVNPQFLLFINSELIQGLDVNHQESLIIKNAKEGDSYTVDIQAYSGRDDDHNRGNTNNLRLFGSICEIDSLINSVYYDLSIPIQIVSRLSDNDTNKIKLQDAIETVINTIDLREPYSEEFYSSLQECSKYIKERIYNTLSGESNVIATCVGHTHIDVAWWWTVEQTKEKVVRTFSTMLKLMDEYPDFKFMSSQPQLYKFVKDRYPDLYEKIKLRVKEGRWETEGGMWLEADCNVTSGESLVRQLLHGKKFFKDEFNAESKILWLPDVFGYSGALPQILKKSGIKYFMTTKIAWNQFNKFPMDTFWWRGIDGSEIFTHLITTQDKSQSSDSFYTTYNGYLEPISVMRSWERYQEKALHNDVLVSYGYGDGGGGPSRPQIENGLRLQHGINGTPKVRFESATTYFDEMYDKLRDNPKLPRWVGELYLEYHRGTYTSMARNKKSNRKCEILWQDVEFFSVLASAFNSNYPAQEIYDSWENILLNQFHDILPGTSIKEVYDVTKEDYELLEKRATQIIREKLAILAQHCASKPNDIIVFNSLSFPRTELVELDAHVDGNCVTDCEGNIIAINTNADGKQCFVATNVPSKGYAVFSPTTNESMSAEKTAEIRGNTISTCFYDITLDDKGQFIRLYDKIAQRDVLKNGAIGNALNVYEDKPMYYDNWDIDIYHIEKWWLVDDVAQIDWIENNSTQAVLYIKRNFLHSVIVQKIKFYKHTKRIDFQTTVDWKQYNLLLKTEFPVNVNAINATYDIQFGNLQRPTHCNTSWDAAKFEVCAHKWADISEGNFGVSILNDCKYGHSIHDSNISLTLIKSGIEPNPTTDQEVHNFTYSLFPHSDDWQTANTAQQAHSLNTPLYSVIAQENSDEILTNSFVTTSAENILIEAVKMAEDNSGIIIRLHEYHNKRGSVLLNFGNRYSAIYECDLMENEICKYSVTDNTLEFELSPYEIKTFKLKS